ncbi:unnamed protein product [Thelazia callipaeda]|uniref:RRM domain-containing protein n=1 Tax=Thelazia callipaeda TaxID=103827 RepID=A0A0N5CJG0_THECL|nr:unnamed protein product [Thelazia callipaeda]
MNGHYRNGPRFDRIDQEEVPESKHTVFIRGIPGHIKTDEVKDFFEDHVGPCSFDFIKLSQDQQKLFVAVRFETRDAAKECMHNLALKKNLRYKDGDVLGYPVEMTWFRDIRRYVSYQQSQGLRPPKVHRNRNYNNRNRTSYDRSSRNDYSSSRSPAHSQRRSSHERSGSVASRRRSHSSQKSRLSRASSYSAPPHEHSVSPHPPPSSPHIKREAIEKGETPPLPPSSPPLAEKADNDPKKAFSSHPLQNDSQSPVERKSRKSRKSKKRRKRRSPSSSSSDTANHSSDELSESELRKKILKKRKEAQKNNEESFKPIVKPTLGKWEEQEPETTILQNTTLKFGLESSEDIPKRVFREPLHATKNMTQQNINKPDGMESHQYSSIVPTAEMENPLLCNKKGAKEPGKETDLLKTEGLSTSTLFATDIDTLLGKRVLSVPTNDLKNAQTNVFNAAVGQQSLNLFFDDNDETPQSVHGVLRLSSLTRQLNAETERERKLACLPPELLAKYKTKKKQLEGIFKADCETFGVVTKMLIEKDPELEERLRLALAEAIKDMEEAFTRKMDSYIDQLIISDLERNELEKLFEVYCTSVMNRLERQEITLWTTIDLFRLGIKYNLKDTIYKTFKKITARWMCVTLENIMQSKGLYGLRRDFNIREMCMELDDIECCFDYARWLEEFMSPFFRAKDPGHRDLWGHDFKQHIILMREAVLNGDWTKLGYFLGLIPSLRQNIDVVPREHRSQVICITDKNRRRLFPFAITVFRTGVERFMQFNISRELITKLATQFMLILIAGEQIFATAQYDSENNSLIYISELLMYAIANGQKQEMIDLNNTTSSLPCLAYKNKCTTVLRVYNLLSRYEYWRLLRIEALQRGHVPVESSSLADEFITSLMDVPSGQESVLIFASVHYMTCIGKLNDLIDTLIQCCRRTPYAIVDCYRALQLNGMADEAKHLLETILPQNNVVLHPILFTWLQPRLSNLMECDMTEEMLFYICQLLFMFLDYGENRGNDCAWVCLWTSIQHVEKVSFLSSQWAPRKLWWPKFHSVKLSEAGTKSRDLVFERLRSIKCND